MSGRLLRSDLHQRFRAGGDVFRGHVGQAVDNIHRRIEFRHQVGDFLLQTAVAGEAQIDDRAIELSAENRGMDHARPRRTTALRNRGAVKHNGVSPALGAGCGFLQVRIFGQADFHGTHAIVERQVQQIVAFRLGNAGDQGGGVNLAGGPADAEPTPAFSVLT